jgi:hypothetical protein
LAGGAYAFEEVETTGALETVAGSITGDAALWKVATSETFATVKVTTLSAGDAGAGGVAGRIYRARDSI